MEKTLWPLVHTTTKLPEGAKDKFYSYFFDSRVIKICDTVDDARRAAQADLASKGIEHNLRCVYEEGPDGKRIRILDVIFECPDGTEYRYQALPIKYISND